MLMRHIQKTLYSMTKRDFVKLLEDNTVERLYTTGSLFAGKHDKITVLEV